MKKSFFTYSFSIIFLTCFALVVSFFVRPVFNAVSNELQKIQESYIASLEENFGLSISYDSLSPSILSGIRMVNISISESENKASLVTIDSVKLSWNILKLLSENPTDALGKLIITGFSANYDHFLHDGVVQRLAQFFDMKASEQSEVDETIITSGSLKNEELPDVRTAFQSAIQPLFSVPIDIQLKNTSLSYSNDNITVQTLFSRIELFDQDVHGQIKYTANTNVRIETKNNLSDFGDFNSRITLKGWLTESLENSFTQISITSLQDSDYVIPRFDIHASFEDNTLNAVAMQNLLPFSLEVVCDTIEKDLMVVFHADNFRPDTLIDFQGSNVALQYLEGARISGVYGLNYNWQSDEIGYDVNGDIALHSLLPNEVATVDYILNGDNEVLSIPSLGITSESISISYSGSVHLETFIPEGLIEIEKITAPSGNTLSSEIYLESFENELTIFSPEVHLEDKTLTALQIDIERFGKSLDFNFEISDYSRIESSEPGLISANGSYDFGTDPFLQLELLSESFFLASVNEVLMWYLPEEQQSSLEVFNSFASPYIFSFNAYFSSNFDSYAYSLPYAVIANTQKDDEFLLFSANGNESVFQLPTFNLLVGGQSVQAELSGVLGEDDADVFFNSSIFLNSLPYTFSGAFRPSEYVTITGDYDSNIAVNFLENSAIQASIQTQSLPIAFNNFFLSLSFDSEIRFSSADNWFADIVLFDVENVSSISTLRPRFIVSGEMSNNGMFFERVVYSDTISTLDGNLASSWNISETSLENATFNLSLMDGFSNERYELNLEMFNLSGASFSDDNFLENMFFSADALIQDSPAGRFANFQTEANTINALLTAQGSLENPSANLTVDKASFLLGNERTEFSGNIALEDHSVSANDVDVVLGNIAVTDIFGNISLSDFSGSVRGLLDGKLSNTSYFAEKTFTSPVSLNLMPLGNNKELPLNEKSFKVDVVFEKMVSTFLPELSDYPIELLRTPGRFDLSMGNDDAFSAFLLDSGEINVKASDGFFVEFEGFGIIENDELTMVLNDIYADAEDFSRLVDLPVFSLHSGIVTGSGTLTGLLNDIQIDADLYGKNMEISIPDYVNERLICADFPVSVTENIFSSYGSYFVAQETKTGVNLDVELSLEQLNFTYLSLEIDTLDNDFVLGKYVMDYGSFEGYAETDLSIYVESELVEVRGFINTKDMEAITMMSSAQAGTVSTGSGYDYGIIIDLVITIENQSQFYFPSKNTPIIRGLVNQVEPLHIQMDTQYATSLITGEFEMRGGEILYLNRTFFARNATAVLNDSVETFDPRLTASAEIRERDQDGDPVRIMLSVENQRLTQLDPSFESIPSMSEQDIMTLLGQIILGTADDASPLSIIGGLADYGTQLAVFRGIEDNVRDTLNLDIFSLRTMFLQNAFTYALGSTETQDLTVGDFLDNTTIYAGKFLDETLYADAMLTFVYDSDRIDLGLRGLVFQPEFGLELPSPFATIRWEIAPDLTTDWNLLVPYTSISFSWEFDF